MERRSKEISKKSKVHIGNYITQITNMLNFPNKYNRKFNDWLKFYHVCIWNKPIRGSINRLKILSHVY